MLLQRDQFWLPLLLKSAWKVIVRLLFLKQFVIKNDCIQLKGAWSYKLCLRASCYIEGELHVSFSFAGHSELINSVFLPAQYSESFSLFTSSRLIWLFECVTIFVSYSFYNWRCWLVGTVYLVYLWWMYSWIVDVLFTSPLLAGGFLCTIQ